jgi:hypothetical protein
MKWFDRWFYNKVRWCWQRADVQHPDWKIENDALDEVLEKMTGVTKSSKHQYQITVEERDITDDGLRIDIKKLTGGWVVTFRTDNPADKLGNYVEPTKNSYIIRDDLNFSDELCKLLTLEQLRN